MLTWPGCCCGFPVCLTVRQCNNATLSGVGLVVEKGGATIAAGSTDGAGVFCFELASAGEIVVTPTHASYPGAGEATFSIEGAGDAARTLYLGPCGTLPDCLHIEDDHGFAATMELRPPVPGFGIHWECTQDIEVGTGVGNQSATAGSPLVSPCYPTADVVVRVTFRLTCVVPTGPFGGTPGYTLSAEHAADYPTGPRPENVGTVRWVDWRDLAKTPGDATKCVDTPYAALGGLRYHFGSVANGALTCDPFVAEMTLEYQHAGWILPSADHGGEGLWQGYAFDSADLYPATTYHYVITPEAAP